ncbi:unnamed protein product [Mytilus coruscus]|uniref:CCHC-type domain-containing protein n=1 Tax=Mytilus coruscus TaxID=42192 RepID=A0A6J8AW95_MYTCO|nr:unnamed protein product [Mytilus coruscus]
MATEGKESDIELSVEELEHIAAAFKEMGVKPKADSASDFKHWFQGTLKQPIKIEPVPPKAAASIETQSKGYQSRYIPRIVPFSGSDKDESYDLWKVVMREIEQDQLPNNKKTAHIKMAQSEGEYTELKSMMQQMNKDIGELKRHTRKQLQRQDETRTEGQYQQSTHNNWNIHYRGRGHRGRGQGNRNYRPYWGNTQNTPLQAAETQQQTRRRNTDPIICYKCGQKDTLRMDAQSGKQNTDADALSRLPESTQQQKMSIKIESIKAFCDAIQPVPYINCLSGTPEKEPEATELNSYCIDIRKEQHSDPVLKSWFTSIQQRRRPRRAEVVKSPSSSRISTN